MFLFISTGYVAMAVHWIPRVRTQINPDGVAYISLAQRWLAGDFANAVSGHWGPMFSWLLTPLLAAGIEPLLACKIETFAAGLAALVATWLFSIRYTERVWLRALVCLALAPLFLAWAASLITPDLLLVCGLAFYGFFVSDPSLSKRSTVAAAICGALVYLTKSYGFVFFLLHFSAICAARWWWSAAARRGEIMRRYGLGLAVFFALALPWGVVLSLKYDRMTFGTAGAYNFGLVGPANGPVGAQAHPMHTQGLLAPPNENAVSAWDDPARMRFPDWPAPVESWRHLAALFSHNSSILYQTLRNASILVWPLALGACVVFAFPGLRKARSRLLFATVLSGALYAAGFLPLLIDPRYLWILVMLCPLLAVGLIDLLAEKFRWHAVLAATIAAAIMASFVFGPSAKMPLPEEIDVESARLARTWIEDGVDLRGRRLATNGFWTVSLYLAYFTDAQFFGSVIPGDPVRTRRQIDDHRIDTFLLWGNDAEASFYLDGFTPVSAANSGGPCALFERAAASPEINAERGTSE